MKINDQALLTSQPTCLEPQTLDKVIKSVFDWKCILLGGQCTFYMGMGRNKNYWFNRMNQRWMRVGDNLKFDLPAKTIVLAEAVQEGRGEGKTRLKAEKKELAEF